MAEKKAKRTFSDRFYGLLENLFKEIDQEKIQSEVVSLKAGNPKLSREALAEKMTKSAARKAATLGIAAGATTGPIGLLVMAPDIFNLVRQQSRLILSIAFLYDQKPRLQERFREVLATLAVASGASASRQGVRYLLMRGVEQSFAEKILRKVAGRYMIKRIPKMIPIAGAVFGGAINYFSVLGTGKAAVHYYSGMDRDVPTVKKKQRMTPRKVKK